MLILLLIGTLTSHVLTETCNSPEGTREAFRNYLNCLKEQLDSNYKTFEDELHDGNRKAAAHCFARNFQEANARERCVIAQEDFNEKAWERNGPLRNCSICRTLAQSAIKALLNGLPEEQKCIRKGLAKAIAKEADSCIRKRIYDHSGVPELPDIEEGSTLYRDEVISSISDNILIKSRLSFCEDRKPNRAAITRKCMKRPFKGYLEKHCSAISKCESNIPSECRKRVDATRQATCECITEVRDELKRRIAGIADIIKDVIHNRGDPGIGTSTKVDKCVQNIQRQLLSSVIDWRSVIDDTLTNCTVSKTTGQALGFDSLLSVGCRKVVGDKTETATEHLKTGFDFINNLIDAMVERSERFCGDFCEYP